MDTRDLVSNVNAIGSKELEVTFVMSQLKGKGD